MLDRILNSPYHQGIEALLLLVILVTLEAVLSADNAIALAAIAQGLEDSTLQRKALNIGLLAAYVLRMLLILTATWVTKYWQFEVLGAAYLLWLVWQYFTSRQNEKGEHQGPRFANLWQAIPMIAFTDLAFSLDSVTTAIAVSQETWLVLTGATIGIIALRFMAGLFIRWLDEFEHLSDAGYLAIAVVGCRLLARAINDEFVPPEWAIVTCIALIFIWGFSKRNELESKTSEIETAAEVEKVEIGDRG